MTSDNHYMTKILQFLAHRLPFTVIFRNANNSWRGYDIETLSISLAHCQGNPTALDGFPLTITEWPVMWRFDVCLLSRTIGWIISRFFVDIRHHGARVTSRHIFHRCVPKVIKNHYKETTIIHDYATRQNDFTHIAIADTNRRNAVWGRYNLKLDG